MPVVTRIVEHPRRPGRYVVEVDGRAAATVALDALSDGGVHVGAEVTDGMRSRLEAAAASLATYDRALTLLAARARSTRELRLRLRRAGEPPPLVEAALERLTAAGLLDDAAYARQLAHAKLVGQGMSVRRLRQELFKRGVARDVGEAAIAAVGTDDAPDAEAAAVALARRRVRSLAGLDPEARRRRLSAFLARRGYDVDVVRAAVRAALAAEPEEAERGGADDV